MAREQSVRYPTRKYAGTSIRSPLVGSSCTARFANLKTFVRQGWSILQHIVYLRGTITISESAFYVVSFANVMSFKIDNQAYGGNLRGNQFPAPSIIYLRTGEHKIYTTAIMDVRANGG